MIIDRRTEDLEGGEPPPLREPAAATAYAGFMALATLALGVLWGPVDNASRQAAARFRTEPGKNVVEVATPGPKDADDDGAKGKGKGKGGPGGKGKGGPGGMGGFDKGKGKGPE